MLGRCSLSFLTFLLAASTIFLAHPVGTTPQGGDQFLDGIGETGLVARYVLGGNAEDSSQKPVPRERCAAAAAPSSKTASSAASCC